jgi:CheY-like chemotaxis protein
MTEPLRLLIVDDDPGHREICRRFLERHVDYKYDVVEAAVGSEGLALCRALSPDCILLDYRLPDLDGLSFLKALGDESDGVPFPVIMMTGGGDDKLMAEAMRAGAVDYLPKGVLSTESLGRAVVNAVEKYRPRMAITPPHSQ